MWDSVDCLALFIDLFLYFSLWKSQRLPLLLSLQFSCSQQLKRTLAGQTVLTGAVLRGGQRSKVGSDLTVVHRAAWLCCSDGEGASNLFSEPEKLWLISPATAGRWTTDHHHQAFGSKWTQTPPKTPAGLLIRERGGGQSGWDRRGRGYSSSPPPSTVDRSCGRLCVIDASTLIKTPCNATSASACVSSH